MTNGKRAPALLIIAMLAAVFLVGVLATGAQAALRHLDGTVLSKNVSNRTFQIKAQSGNRIRIMVNANTRFERINGGFNGLRAGLRVQIDAKRTSKGLLAKHVETRQSGGGGGGGGDDAPSHG